MSDYGLTLLALVLALVAQSVASGLALEVALRQPGRRAWMAVAIGAGLLALQHGYTLELGLRTGLYDLRQGVLGVVGGICLAAGVIGLRRQAGTPPPR